MKAKNPQDTLTPYFDNSVTAVRQTFARLQGDYVLPTWDLLRALFLAYPIPFVFFSILVALSFFPVLAFITVSAAALLTALTLAVCLALAFSTGVFLFLGGILAATLGFALLLSGFLTTFATSAYLSGRLVLLLHRSGRSGFRAWYQEVIHLFFPSPAHLAPGEDLYASEDSGILVGQEVKDGPTPKIEPSPRELSDNVLNRAG